MPISTFIIGIAVGSIGCFCCIDKINNEYDRNVSALHFESSLNLYWALANDKIELAKNLVAQDINVIQGKMIKDKETVIIPPNLDSLIKNSLNYKYAGTVFSTLPIKASETGTVGKWDSIFTIVEQFVNL